MISLDELKRVSGCKSFTEFKKAVIHVNHDGSLQTTYYYRMPGNNNKRKQIDFTMSTKELNEAVRHEKPSLKNPK